jgi:hypothetical protein
MMTKRFYAYRSDGWGGGYYKVGFTLGRLHLSGHWQIWKPISVWKKPE